MISLFGPDDDDDHFELENNFAVRCLMFTTHNTTSENRFQSTRKTSLALISCLVITPDQIKLEVKKIDFDFSGASFTTLKRAFQYFQGCMMHGVEWWDGIYMWKLHVLLFWRSFDSRSRQSHIKHSSSRFETRRSARWLNLTGMFIMKSQLFFHSSSFDWNFRLLWCDELESLATMWRRFWYYNTRVKWSSMLNQRLFLCINWPDLIRIPSWRRVTAGETLKIERKSLNLVGR